MSLLTDIESVAQTLSPDELPNHTDVLKVLGATVKVLEASGVKVAEDLLPKPVESVVAPIAEAAAPAVEQQVDKALSPYIARFEAALKNLEGDPAPAATAPEPVTSVAPVAPPIEGAS